MEGEGAVATAEGSEAVELLQRLLQINTVNPPGNEEPAQELLAQTLTEAGLECELLAAEAGRPNLVARLRGESPGPTLCLLGHVDTVPAEPSEWSFDPWAGDVVDGEIRGRGAQDMKDQVAAEVAAAASLAREGWRPSEGELLVVATADEEMGAGAGARWLCREHPEAVRCDYVLNEGGGVAFELDGRRFYTLCVGEKGVFRFLVRTHGRAGHASVPALGDNALLKLAPLLERLRSQPPIDHTAEAIEFASELSGEDVGDESRRAGRRRRSAAVEGARGGRLPAGAHASGDARADEGPRVREGERHPLNRRGSRGLPGAAGRRGGRGEATGGGDPGESGKPCRPRIRPGPDDRPQSRLPGSGGGVRL